MENLCLSTFTFTIRAVDMLILPPYKGSTFRGGFGHAFKRIVCTARNQECRKCVLKDKCIYVYVFETISPSDSPIQGRHTDAPHPFVLNPPLDEKRSFAKGEDISFELILIGRAIDYLPYFIYTFEEVGKIGIGRKKGKYHLLDVRCRLSDDKEEVIYSGVDKRIRRNYRIISIKDLFFTYNTSFLTLNFLTPTRIKADSKLLTENLDFFHLFKTLIGRIQLLSHFHCNAPYDECNELIEKAKTIKIKENNLYWYDWERYSNRKKERMKLGGLKGSITYKGDIKDFMSYIRTGEFINVGKGTSFGMGNFIVVPQ